MISTRPLTFVSRLVALPNLFWTFGRVLWLREVTPKIILTRCLTDGDLSLKNPLIQNYVQSLIKEFKQLSVGNKEGVSENISIRLSELKPVIDIHNENQNLIECLHSLQDLYKEGKSNDAELQNQIEEERQEYIKKLEELEQKLLIALLPHDAEDNCTKVMMEINAGVGGQEAMLFARELFDMYCSYIEFKGWSLDGCYSENTDIGGLRQATLLISGNDSYLYLKHEAGVHRVQRIPATEKSGRLHTSTVSVTVIPQPEEIEVQVEESDLRIETKRASGAGGQHVNKTESAVRITHIPTGISVECQTDRSQIQNRKEALRKLHAILYKNSVDKQAASVLSARKSQVKSNLRSEKIRTYNFNQDRITDHRISGNMHNLLAFMNGCEALDELIEKLELESKKILLFQRAEEANKIRC